MRDLWNCGCRVQGQADGRVLDNMIEFDEVVRACVLMRTVVNTDSDHDPLEQLVN